MSTSATSRSDLACQASVANVRARLPDPAAVEKSPFGFGVAELAELLGEQ